MVEEVDPVELGPEFGDEIGPSLPCPKPGDDERGDYHITVDERSTAATAVGLRKGRPPYTRLRISSFR